MPERGGEDIEVGRVDLAGGVVAEVALREGAAAGAEVAGEDVEVRRVDRAIVIRVRRQSEKVDGRVATGQRVTGRVFNARRQQRGGVVAVGERRLEREGCG